MWLQAFAILSSFVCVCVCGGGLLKMEGLIIIVLQLWLLYASMIPERILPG